MFSVIVPVRDEPGINRFLLDLHQVLVDIPDEYEVLVAMGDREKLNTRVDIMPHQRVIKTYGDSLERSILGGFSHAKGERVLVMDADGTHPLNYVPKMWRLLDDYEMVVGSRFVVGASYESSSYRHFVTWLTKGAARWAGSGLRDPMSGFFAFRREVLDHCHFRPLTWKTALEVELRAKPRLIEVPIDFRDRYGNQVGRKSKTSFGTGLKILWQLYTEAMSG